MDIAQSLQTLLAEHALALLFLNILLEQAGLPIPAYPSLIVGGAVAQSGHGPTLAEVMAAGVLACVVADLLWYGMGRRHGARLMRGICRISLSPDTCVRKSTHLYHQLGPRLLLVAKFLPGAGALTTLMAGSARTRLWVFLLYDAAGAAIWVGSGLMLGVFFEDAVTVLLRLLTTYVVPGLVALAVAFGLYLLWKWAMRQRVIRRSARVPRLQVKDLLDLQTGGRPHLLLDVRPESAEEDGIPGAVRMRLNARAAELIGLPPDQPIIVYCECPREVSAAYLAERILSTGRGEVYALAGGLRAWREAQEPATPTPPELPPPLSGVGAV
jgi:membrane protein DedA with SNARE-associated domain/rhodanese-related sulfurtransferase